MLSALWGKKYQGNCGIVAKIWSRGLLADRSEELWSEAKLSEKISFRTLGSFGTVLVTIRHAKNARTKGSARFSDRTSSGRGAGPEDEHART
jgi:hypothetical protein